MSTRNLVMMVFVLKLRSLVQGDVAGSITGSVIGSGLPNGLPGGISPRGLLSGMGQSVNSPMRRSPHKSSPHTSSPSPRHPLPSPRTWDVDQALNAASLVPGDSHVEHGRGMQCHVLGKSYD